jgi:hypothetical protein
MIVSIKLKFNKCDVIMGDNMEAREEDVYIERSPFS